MPRPSNTNHILNARVTTEQWNHLAMQAHQAGVNLSEAIRQVIERDIDAQPGVKHEDGSPGETFSYRTLLTVADFSQLHQELEGDASS